MSYDEVTSMRIFDEGMYAFDKSQYFTDGVSKGHRNSLVTWWESSGAGKSGNFEHSSVVITDGVYLDVYGVFDRKSTKFGEYGRKYLRKEGTLEEFKQYLRSRHYLYGESEKKAAVQNILRACSPVVRLKVRDSYEYFALIDWSNEYNVVRVQRLLQGGDRTNSSVIYITNGGPDDITMAEFVNRFAVSLGWFPIYEVPLYKIKRGG